MADTTTDYFRRQGNTLADHIAEEANHLYNKWGSDDGTPDALKELSTIAANLAGRLQQIAGDALEQAERLDPSPIGFAATRPALKLVHVEEIRAEVQRGEHAPDPYEAEDVS